MICDIKSPDFYKILIWSNNYNNNGGRDGGILREYKYVNQEKWEMRKLVFVFYLRQNIKSEGRRQEISDVEWDNVKENRKMALVGCVI